MSTHTVTEVRNPGMLKSPGTLKALFGVLFLIGFVGFLAGYRVDPQRAWSSYLIGHFYFFCLALGGLFFASIQWVSSAMWSAPVRRIAEAFTPYLAFSLVTYLFLNFGLHDLYTWTGHEVHLHGKEAYLNIPFMITRNIIAFAIWGFFAYNMIGNSLKQDQSGDFSFTKKNKVWSPIFLIVFALTFSMTSIDLIMSLDPMWFSTIFGVYAFAGLFYTTLALVTVIAILLRRSGYLKGIVSDDHLHDLGKFMFAFTVFWAYIGFSQFMLIWYANLPEETLWYLHRMEGSWLTVSIFLFVGKFVIPFVALLPRSHKRSENWLLAVGTWMLLIHFVDLYWLIRPEFSPAGATLSWMEIVIPFLFLGLFGFSVVSFLSRNCLVAIKDPRLLESMSHHQ